MLSKLFGAFSQDMAIDLGTANTLVYAEGRGIIVDEPSVVAVVERGGKPEILAVGGEANRMIGRTPAAIRAIRPMRGGVIADFDIAQEMIRHFIRQANRRRGFIHPRVIVSVPSGATPVERRAIREAAESAGARHVFLIEGPLAAAIGAGLPVMEAAGSMIVDIGGGTTEIAVLSLGGVVLASSLPVGGFGMDEAISGYIRRAHNLLIGEVTAERIKREIGAAVPPDGDGRMMEIRGRDLVSGVPRSVVVDERQIAESLADAISAIVRGIRLVLEDTAPELAADIVDRGIMLSGGGALLARLDILLEYAIGLPVIVPEDPLTCAVRGAGSALENLKRFATALEG